MRARNSLLREIKSVTIDARMRKSIFLVVGLICVGCSTDSETTIQPTAKSGGQPQSNPQSVAVAPIALPTPPTRTESPSPARTISATVVRENAKPIQIETNVGCLQQATNIAKAIQLAQTQDEFHGISSVIEELNLEYQRRFEIERKREFEGHNTGTTNRTDLRIASYMAAAMDHLEEAIAQRTKGTIQMSDAYIGSALLSARLAEQAEQERNNPALAQQRRADEQRKVEEFMKARKLRR